MTTSFTLTGPVGLDALPITIQCSIDKTLPSSFHVEGPLSKLQAREILVRVRSAIVATDLCPWPTGRVTITIPAQDTWNSTPAALDLPIALAIAGIDTDGLLVAGELGLDGSVRPVRGALQATLLARALGLRGVLLPASNTRIALEALPTQLAVHAIAHLADLSQALVTRAQLPEPAPAPASPDFADIRGQARLRAAVELAVRGRTGLLLSGPPGVGKTMIARRIPGVLPSMSLDERVQITLAYSAIGLSDGLITQRPFRAPHHTISAAALGGGGITHRRPGEVHLAQGGVLFLDEVDEFAHEAVETIAATIARMPTFLRPIVVASAKTCPCGWHGSTARTCTCAATTIARHAARVAAAAAKLGLTITVAVHPFTLDEMRTSPAGEDSATMAARLTSTRGNAV